MRRKQFLIALSSILIAPPGFAQKPRVPSHIALFWVGSSESTHLRKAFLDGLTALGYKMGRDYVVEDRTNVIGYEQLADTAAGLARLKPDVIVCYGATASQAAKKATSTIPIVIITGSDPVKQGFAASLSRPGANITGVTSQSADIASKRLQLLREVMPQILKVALIFNSESKAELAGVQSVQSAAKALDIQVHLAAIRLADDLDNAFLAMTNAKVDAVQVIGSTMLFANRARIMALAAHHRLPVMAPQVEYVEAGALLSYGADIPAAFGETARQVDKILKGAAPAELPFEQSSAFQLAVNLKIAHMLGLSVPQPVLLRADRLIE